MLVPPGAASRRPARSGAYFFVHSSVDILLAPR